MTTPSVPCTLLTVDGTVLASGCCWPSNDAGEEGEELELVVTDAPGRLVQHCLTNRTKDVLVRIGDAAPTPATLTRLGFDRTRGRLCSLHLDPTHAAPALRLVS